VLDALRSRSLAEGIAMPPFMPGQQVVWVYYPQKKRRTAYAVAAEVVYPGLLRTRIRVQDTQGHSLLRWVKPSRLHLKQPNETVQLYPRFERR
jgi:hypothetical protein